MHGVKEKWQERAAEERKQPQKKAATQNGIRGEQSNTNKTEVMKNCRGKKAALSMVWIDYQKTYDMVPHTRIRKSMVMCGVAEGISHVLIKSMEN